MALFRAPFENVAHLGVLADGRVFASGHDGVGCRFALLDPAARRWEGPVTVASWLPLAQGVVASDGRALATGQPTVAITTDPLAVAPVLPPREDWLGIPVALAPDGVLIAGGFRTPAGPGAEVEIARAGVWTPVAPLPGPRWSGSGVQARGGQVVIGGRTPVMADQFSVDVYEPARDTWTRTRPDWPAPELPASGLAELRAISARRGGSPPDPSPEPTRATWTSPVALADGSVLLFVDAVGEFGTSLGTMARLDPARLGWSDPVRVPEGVAQVGRPVVGLADGRLVTTGWSRRAGGHRLFAWSRADGWRKGPDVALSGRTPLALLPDGRVLFVARGEQTLISLRV